MSRLTDIPTPHHRARLLTQREWIARQLTRPDIWLSLPLVCAVIALTAVSAWALLACVGRDLAARDAAADGNDFFAPSDRSPKSPLAAIIRLAFDDAPEFDHDDLPGPSGRDFPGRDPATFASGSPWEADRQALAVRAGVLQAATTLDGWRTRYETHLRHWNRLPWDVPQRYLALDAHQAAQQGDWARYLARVEFSARLSPQHDLHAGYLNGMHGQLLADHSDRLPASILRQHRRLYLDLLQRDPLAEEITPAFTRQTRLYHQLCVLTGPIDSLHSPTTPPVLPSFAQIHAALYPFRRGRVPLAATRLQADLSGDGLVIRYPSDAYRATGLYGGLRVHIGDHFAEAAYRAGQARQVQSTRHARLRLLIAQVDAELYRRDHGAWPPSIDALGEPALRLDPRDVTGGTLLLRPTVDGGLRIWSRGWDGADGGGLYCDEDGWIQQGDDIVQLLPPRESILPRPADPIAKAE